MTETPFLPLPDDDGALILRRDARDYGFPAPPTLARWACRPSEAPAPLAYVICGRHAAYRVGDLRAFRAALTFNNSTERTVAAERARPTTRQESSVQRFEVQRRN